MTGAPEPLTPPIDADRRRRGPYTAGGAIAQALVPVALVRWPALVAEHDIEIRAVAPDLHDRVPARRRTVAASIPPAERILVPAAQRTLRVANGFTDFVIAHLTALGHGPYLLTVHNLAEADPADRELLRVLRRRVPAALLTLVTAESLPGTRPAAAPLEPEPEWVQDRVAALLAEGGAGARLGEVPWLLARGADRERAAEAFRFAAAWSLEHGCHAAVAELGTAGLAFAEPDTGCWWSMVHDVAMALAALGEEDRAEAVLTRARAQTTSPVWHSTIAYCLAMLYTRHKDPERRDLDRALGWVNTGITICELLPDAESRAVKLGFDLNGKALIESRRGDLAAALRLVQRAIELADEQLADGAQPIHRLVLRANRAQLRIAAGDLAAARTDLDAVIAADPGYPDYYLDRGNLHHRLGRPAEAIADYTAALAAGPPFPEAHFNRAEVYFALGDHAAALADLDRALDLDPDFLDARINRAGLLVELEQYDRAAHDVAAGLAVNPGNPHLLCAEGQIAAAQGDPGGARGAFDAALAADPTLVAAWAARGALAYGTGDPAGAVSDLSHAADLAEDPAILFNLALAHRATGSPALAREDLLRASTLAPADPDIRAELQALG